jgi:hypothetical protein
VASILAVPTRLQRSASVKKSRGRGGAHGVEREEGEAGGEWAAMVLGAFKAVRWWSRGGGSGPERRHAVSRWGRGPTGRRRATA